MKKVFLLLFVAFTTVFVYSEGEGFKKIRNFKFTTQDLEGNKVTESIFKKADVTMVNIWATWCGPCKHELPDIARIAKKFKQKGVQVIAICADTMDEYGEIDEGAIDEASEILQDAGCDFTCLCLDESMGRLLQEMQAFPTTIFFDKNGNVIGQVLIGSRSEAKFSQAINALIK